MWMQLAVGLRERKKTDTRRAIASAALFLAVERGPDAVTVDDIAAAADVSPRTVFNYFATKEEAILGLDPARRLELVQLAADRPARESPLAVLKTVFVEIATGVPEAAELARTKAELVRTYPQLYPAYVAAHTSLEGALVDAIAARTGLDPVRSPYPRLVVSTAMTAYRVALDRARPGGRALVKAIDEAFEILGAGLRPPGKRLR